MAYVITVANQKGGCGKTTTSSMLAHLLSKQYKVLAVDLDSQGNLTELLTLRPIREFRLDGIGGALDAIKKCDPRQYILSLTETLHLLPSDELLGTLPTGNVPIKKMLSIVEDVYDFIIIDTAPALSFTLTGALIASNGVIAMFEAGKFCYSALQSFSETVEAIQNSANKNLQFLGIVCTLIDARRGDNKDYLTLVQQQFGKLCFKTIIKRNAAAGRLAIGGLFDNVEISIVEKQFAPLISEVLKRVKK